MLRSLLIVLLVLVLGACATSHRLIGQPRPAIDPARVRMYYTLPTVPYEEIALLDTSSGPFTYGEQNKTDAVIDNLRREAAQLGANGVLLRGMAHGPGGGGVGIGVGGGSFHGSGFSHGGIGVNISPSRKYARGIAIYVANPLPEPVTPPPDTSGH